MRTISEIADEIFKDWKSPNYAALPYLTAMRYLRTMQDKYGMDDARIIVLYFLSNASSWRGDVARRIKRELRDM